MTSKTPEEHDDETDWPTEGRGRAANRREAKSFDALALELIALAPDKCARFPVSEGLLRCLRDVQQTRAKAARRRHLRHLAGMLRKSPSEVEAIRAFLAGRSFTRVSGNEEIVELQALRSALCATQTSSTQPSPESFSSALEATSERLPHIDLDRVRSFCLALHKLSEEEQAEAKEYRLLFKELRRAEQVGIDEDDSDDSLIP